MRISEDLITVYNFHCKKQWVLNQPVKDIIGTHGK